MKFCSKCKSILIPLEGDILKCKKCGLETKGKLVVKEKEKKMIEIGKGVVEDKNIFATYPHKCRKCGFGKAEVITMGPWYSDEDVVTKLKCGKCGFAEILEKKTS